MIGRIYRTSGCSVDTKEPVIRLADMENKMFEISSLQDLLNIVEEHEPIILHKTTTGFDIEIYDDYRE